MERICTGLNRGGLIGVASTVERQPVIVWQDRAYVVLRDVSDVAFRYLVQPFVQGREVVNDQVWPNHYRANTCTCLSLELAFKYQMRLFITECREGIIQI